MVDKKTSKLVNIKQYKSLFVVFAISALLFIFAALNNDLFNRIMSVATYLTWHNIMEFSSILISFSIFIVTYYIYEESRNLQAIILGCSFLAMGALDAFHTLSYKGMADFFIANTDANRATTLWILSRFIGSIGFLASVSIPYDAKSNINRHVFVLPTIVIVSIILILVTFYPEFLPYMFVEGQGLTRDKIFMEYIIVFIMGITFIKVLYEYNMTNSKREYLLLIALLISVFSELAFIKYASVYDAFNYLGHIYKIIAYLILFKAIYVINVSEPYREMIKAQNELKEYSDNLNMIVKQRTKELEDINEVLMMDIEYAKEMQRSLLPAQLPKEEFVCFKAEYMPADRLSGDFYNVIKIDDNNIAVYIGDVVGHGVSAAMLTVFANQNITPLKEDEDTIEIISPGYVLKKLYKSFNITNFKVETYLVMLYGIFNIEKKTFTYSSAGINVPPIILKSSGEIYEIEAKGFPICKLGEYIMPFYEDKEIQLDKGDKIIFYTDGLVESKNSSGETFDKKNMMELLKTNYALTADELHGTIKEKFCNHIGKKCKIMDDITYLVLEVK